MAGCLSGAIRKAVRSWPALHHGQAWRRRSGSYHGKSDEALGKVDRFSCFTPIPPQDGAGIAVTVSRS